MQKIVLREEYIKLGQALKAAHFVENGAEAKLVIQEGNVQVNGTTELQRGKKLHGGDRVSFRGEELLLVAGKEE